MFCFYLSPAGEIEHEPQIKSFTYTYEAGKCTKFIDVKCFENDISMLCGFCNASFYTLKVSWTPNEEYTVANEYEYVVRVGESVKYKEVNFVSSDMVDIMNITVSHSLPTEQWAILISG